MAVAECPLLCVHPSPPTPARGLVRSSPWPQVGLADPVEKRQAARWLLSLLLPGYILLRKPRAPQVTEPRPPPPTTPQPRHLPDTAASAPGSRPQHPPGSSLWRAPPGAADAPAAWDRGSVTEPAPHPAPQAEPKPHTQTGTLHLSSEPDPLHVSRELPPNTPNTPVRRPPRGATHVWCHSLKRWART